MAEQGSDEYVERAAGDLFSVSPDPIVVYDLDTRRVVDANGAAELLGREQSEIIDSDIGNFTPEDSDYTITQAREAIAVGVEEGSHSFEWQVERPDGDRRWVDVSLRRATFRGADRLLAFVRDVTDQRTHAQELRESREALRRLHAVTMTDQSVSEKVSRMLAIGTDFLDLEYGYLTEIDEDTQRIRQSRVDHEALAEGSTVPQSESYCRQTLTNRVGVVEDATVEMEDDPARDRFELGSYLGRVVSVDGEDYGTVCYADDEPRNRSFSEAERMFVDIVGRWIGSELEDELRVAELESRQRQLETIFDAPAAFIGLLEPDGTLLRANRPAREFVGVEQGELSGQSFWNCPWFTHSEDL